MTIKTKRIILVSVLSVLSVVTFSLIMSGFNENKIEELPKIETTKEEPIKEPDIVINISTTAVTTTTAPITEAPEEDTEFTQDDEFITTTEQQDLNEVEIIITQESEPVNVIEQNFPEITKPEPPENPAEQLPEEVLTNPDTEPVYQPEQTTVAQTTATPKADEPYNGQKKDGKVYIEGFGWVVDEGGGSTVIYAEGMKENGNKIGYFG